MRDVRLADPAGDPLRHGNDLVVRQSVGDAEKFVSPIPGKPDAVFLFLAAGEGDFLDDLVASGVSVGVVAFLKKVDVDKDRADFLFSARGAFDIFRRNL